MKLTAQISYAFEALLDIAERHGDRKPVNLKEISKRHSIPEKYLLQVMVKLKKKVWSIRVVDWAAVSGWRSILKRFP